jgi:ubiquinone biosynthesis protein UbiJ
MIPKTFSAFVNHLLRQQSWASERLCAHAGSRIRVVMKSVMKPAMQPGFAAPFLKNLPSLSGIAALSGINILVLETGLIESATSDVTPDIVVTIKPAAIPMLLTHHADALKHVELSGNASLASVIQDLVTRLEWDVEEDLSRVIGDIAAHRIATAGKDLFAWQRDAFLRTAENIAEYLTEENPRLARRAELDRFRRDLQELESNLAGVERRFDALRKRFPTPAA